MEYTNIFEPLLIIFLSLLAGLLIGSIGTFYVMIKEHKAMQEEIDAKNRALDKINNLINE